MKVVMEQSDSLSSGGKDAFIFGSSRAIKRLFAKIRVAPYQHLAATGLLSYFTHLIKVCVFSLRFGPLVAARY